MPPVTTRQRGFLPGKHKRAICGEAKVNSNNWSARTTADEASRRAGGRRRYNFWRRCIRDLRRAQVWRLLQAYPVFHRGKVMAIARELKVHASTICRDIQALKRRLRACSQCGQFPRPATADERDDDGMVEQVLAEMKAEGCWVARGPLPRSGE
jgi:hypothetical protein